MKYRFTRIPAAVVLALLAGLALLYVWRGGEVTAFSPARKGETTLIIDAGHGGEDGGAVSPNGTVESQVNLAVALRLNALMDLYGARSVLLRGEDVSLHDPGAQTLREKKVSDLKNRVAAIESTAEAVLVSIHQNTYQNAKYHGAQVFYGLHEDSQSLAVSTQDTLRAALDPDNGRVPAKIPSTIYLMNHITCPAILVECGFLTNPEEERLLSTGEYQTKLAMCLASSYLTYQENESEGETLHESENSLLLHPMRE